MRGFAARSDPVVVGRRWSVRRILVCHRRRSINLANGPREVLSTKLPACLSFFLEPKLPR